MDEEVFVPASIQSKDLIKCETMYNDKKQEIIEEIIKILKTKDNNNNNTILENG
jgi:hypothetical protein